MSWVARASWAAGCPWLGITGKPETFGVTDIGQLKAAGFAIGQAPKWNGSRFVPFTPTGTSPTPPAGYVLPSLIYFTWDIPEILPLQTAYEDFNFNGVVPGQPVVCGVQFDPGFCLTQARVITINTVRLYATNMDAVPITLGEGTWAIQRFT